jgi:hypothetical protein
MRARYLALGAPRRTLAQGCESPWGRASTTGSRRWGRHTLSAALRHLGSLGFPGSGGSTRGRSAAFKTRKWCGFEARPAHSVRYGVIGSPRGSDPRSPGPSPGTAAWSASSPAGSQLRIWAAEVPAVGSARPGDREPAPASRRGRERTVNWRGPASGSRSCAPLAQWRSTRPVSERTQDRYLQGAPRQAQGQRGQDVGRFARRPFPGGANLA